MRQREYLRVASFFDAGGTADAALHRGFRRDEVTGVYAPVVDEAPHDEHVSMR